MKLTSVLFRAGRSVALAPRRSILAVPTSRLLHTPSRPTTIVSSPAARLSNVMPNISKTWCIRSFSTDAGETHTDVVPSMGDSISEGTVAKWHKAVGDPVKVDDVIVSLETDKVTVDINAKANGTLAETLANLGDTVKVGQTIFKIKVGAAPDTKPNTARSEPAKAEPAKAEPAKEEPKKSEPAVRPPAPKPESPKPSTPQPSQPKTTAPQTPSNEASGVRERKVKMTPMRRRIGVRLKDAQNTAAMLTTFQECDMSAITELRSTYQDVFLKKHGTKLGFMSLFVKAAVAALQDQPSVNAVIDGDYVVYRDYYDLSVAVATPRGLVVPVLRNCDKKSFADIEKELALLGNKARNDQIALEDMVGGTFTISNGGVYGSLMGTPIINPPQSAILGMHGINKRAVVVNDKIEIRPMMYLALTYDHRLIDGREAVTFLRKIKDAVEDPRRLLLDL